MDFKSLFAEKIKEGLESRGFPETPANLYQPIDYILSLSGKRIRPLLVLLSADLFKIADINQAVPASLAIEYFHNFTLIHDDIMDKAPLRRGRETVHQKWNDSVAILSGDALLIKAYEELAKCPAHVVSDLLQIFNRIALEVCEGQQLDMDFEVLDHIQQEQYIHMIKLKTSVLLGGALELGAVLADTSVVNREAIYNFGVNLGIAFQLQDDILDAFGDPKTFGKQVGGDIIVNKKTILHILLKNALEDIDLSHFNVLLMLKEDEAVRKITEMKMLYTKYGVKQQADTLKHSYTQLAFNSLAQIEVSEDRKSALYELANRLMNRTQ